MSRRGIQETEQARTRAAGWHCLVFAVLALSPFGEPGAQPEDAGSFEVRAAAHDLVDGVYYVDALINLRLPTEAVEALHSGLPLTIRVEVEVLRRFRLWWDLTAFEPIVQRYQLTYSAVTDRYLVLNINTLQRSSYESLVQALDAVGRIERLPVVDAGLLDDDRRYEFRIRAGLDKDDLPGPLRLLAFWRGDFSIESEWLTWRLAED